MYITKEMHEGAEISRRNVLEEEVAELLKLNAEKTTASTYIRIDFCGHLTIQHTEQVVFCSCKGALESMPHAFAMDQLFHQADDNVF